MFALSFREKEKSVSLSHRQFFFNFDRGSYFQAFIR